jgi:putative two-component system response regulator
MHNLKEIPGNPRILVVDDEPSILSIVKELMESFGCRVETAESGQEALERMGETFDLVLLDVMLPGMDGFEVVRRIRKTRNYNELPIVMVTSMASREDRLQAIEAGANDFINKPVDISELRVRTTTQLRMKHAQDALRQHKDDLELKVQQRTAELEAANRDTWKAHIDTIKRLVLAAEFKDEDTALHIERMSRYSELLARASSCKPDEVETLRLASPMHDVGKIGIPDSVLLKPGKLTENEFSIMKQHTLLGARILEGSPSRLLQIGRVIALSHHEKWDGSGYPNGLAGEDIPFWGRVCAVADVFDALTSERPYKRAFSVDKAVGILREGRGRHFDPHLLDCFMDHLGEVLDIKASCSDPDSEPGGMYAHLKDTALERR